ncbi:type II toxin-antitoxin system VapC family toxin [Spirulina major CS-329]|uniref:type II toxin-antitoxin system VapC family toxin n=1 Tax=Spirulina TaxID=1154 RepID=UPI00232A9554|nr:MULTISPECIES: type II toxin-antitoxin system VapC family toxin [Spirulina]MDB9494362.1 type II toxin-antitoxin system VapC family toxin [Spirulina subsalsa CS-330]MDB9501673.1 type II toxin-antitoxin system VapC family toxin [Spirulina major CS-329]
MNYLIDTHALIWYIQASDKLIQNVATTLEDTENTLYFSIASLWEIAIKLGLEKLKLDNSFHDLEELLKSLSIEILPITFADTETYLCLPLHHRDPFDRILIAQAMNRSLSIITADSAFDAYAVERLWL